MADYDSFNVVHCLWSEDNNKVTFLIFAYVLEDFFAGGAQYRILYFIEHFGVRLVLSIFVNLWEILVELLN